jgi:hypothetical protein
VRGQADADDRQADAATELDQQHAQGDRQADAAAQDGVQAAVARVVVVAAVAVKAELTHQVGEQEIEALTRAGEAAQARGDVVGEVVELLERDVEVEGRVLLAADQQRGLSEVEGGVGGRLRPARRSGRGQMWFRRPWSGRTTIAQPGGGGRSL